MAEQIPFGADSFANNPEPRCPCVLVLDTSGSMRGEPIAQLNAGLAAYRQELMADPLARKRVEVAIITFGPVKVVQEFKTAAGLVMPALSAQGETPMGEAILKAVDLVTARKQDYRRHGIAFFRPWVFLITDGRPSDYWEPAAIAVHEAEQTKALTFFAVGTGAADMEILGDLSVRPPLKLDGLKFASLFQWLSNSQKAVSGSNPDEQVALPEVTWSAV